MKILENINKWISIILLFCLSFQFIGCYTTNNVYGKEIETIYSLIDIDIISHQNKSGVLYYTIHPIYQNTETRIFLFNEVENSEYNKIINHNPDFPFSTYFDVIYYKENVLSKEITYKSREIIETEKKFSPVKTSLVIGLPILGILTLVLTALFSPQEEGK